MSISYCQNCYKYSIWVNEDIVYPRIVAIEPPNEDLNDEIKSIYNEAKTIFTDSPRGATALLRLALQLLLKQLGKEGKNINDDIGELVRDGLDPEIQKLLDTLRVVGNHAVHPGQIDLNDKDKNIVLQLFKILNLIADKMITYPKMMKKLYDEIIPEEAKKQISKRDERNINRDERNISKDS